MSEGKMPVGGYTYKDYKSWGEGKSCEMINGAPFM